MSLDRKKGSTEISEPSISILSTSKLDMLVKIIEMETKNIDGKEAKVNKVKRILLEQLKDNEQIITLGEAISEYHDTIESYSRKNRQISDQKPMGLIKTAFDDEDFREQFDHITFSDFGNYERPSTNQNSRTLPPSPASNNENTGSPEHICELFDKFGEEFEEALESRNPDNIRHYLSKLLNIDGFVDALLNKSENLKSISKNDTSNFVGIIDAYCNTLNNYLENSSGDNESELKDFNNSIEETISEYKDSLERKKDNRFS